MFSGTRGLALLVVILLHIIVGWAFYSGLAQRLAQTIIPPVEIAQIDKPKDLDKPPPPPPKLEEIKPYVPPPEFVDIQAPQEQTNAIAVVTQVQAPVAAPVAAAPAPKPGTPPRMDPKHPLHIGEEWYPDASKRANEEGRCTVQMTVAVDGRVSTESLQTSSGFPRLDEACLKAVHGQRMLPATEDGKPIEKTVSIPIAWKLTNK